MALHAEALIAQAITILDTIDGDADLEAGRVRNRPSPPRGENQIMWRAVADVSRDWQSRDMP
jgi:hypothetical protein